MFLRLFLVKCLEYTNQACAIFAQIYENFGLKTVYFLCLAVA